MSARPKPGCSELLGWLQANLGKRALAPLTGTDAKALTAVAHTLLLYQYCGNVDVLRHAFRVLVLEMQPSTRYFAYHAIAWSADWADREVWWTRAGLAPLERIPVCEHSPEMSAARADARRAIDEGRVLT